MTRSDTGPRLCILRLPLMCLALCILALGACAPVTFVVDLGSSRQTITHSIIQSDGRGGSDRVAIIDVTGVIHNSSKPRLLGRGENPVNLLTEKLNTAAADEHVKAVILRLNTPGGTVTATDAMYREIIRFKARTRKPVLALMVDVTASGGYYLACASDRIIAYPTTITGSIGVIIQTMSFKPALDRLGIQTQAITSGPNKDVGSPLSSMSDEHRAILRRIVDDFYSRFAQLVKASRPTIPPDKFAWCTDGRILTGQDALAVGLVDQLGDVHDAFAEARKLAKLTNADLILYHRPTDHVASPYSASNAPQAAGNQVNLAQFNFGDDSGVGLMAGNNPVGFFYLWSPANLGD